MCEQHLFVWGIIAAVAAVSTCAYFRNRTKGYGGGVWVWGTTTAALGIAVVLLVAFGWPPRVYLRLKESANAIGAVVAASALAWSWFFQTDSRASIANQEKVIDEIKNDLKVVKEKVCV